MVLVLLACSLLFMLRPGSQRRISFVTSILFAFFVLVVHDHGNDADDYADANHQAEYLRH